MNAGATIQLCDWTPFGLVLERQVGIVCRIDGHLQVSFARSFVIPVWPSRVYCTNKIEFVF
jgi:hypothetical protein